MSDSRVVTRFAPSPTGALHVGGARTALFNWAFARRHGGRFVLRMEDTDQARSTPQSTRSILADLRWLGLDWDEGPPCPEHWDDALAEGFDPDASALGDRGPYFQSQRLAIYREHLQRLIDADQAYEDEGAHRFRVPGGDISIADEVLGEVVVKAEQLKDFVIFKSDGFPTFHFAVVVDDALMGVTHVIRGQEHLSNTPKHVALQDALGFDRPRYAHIPLIFNPDGSKMSKRDKAKVARTAARHREWPVLTVAPEAYEAFRNKKSDDAAIAEAIAQELNLTLPEIDVLDFRRSGYLPQVLLNTIALLGWSPGNDIERFDLDFLVAHFGLDRIGKSNARFDRDKLFRFNAEAIAALASGKFRRLLTEHFKRFHPGCLDRLGDHFDAFAASYQGRSRTLGEPVTIGEFFLADDDAIEYDQKAVKKVLEKNDGEGLTVLGEVVPLLESCGDWSVPGLDTLIKGLAEKKGIGLGRIAQPLRVAVSGGTVSPPIGDTLTILGRQTTLERIKRCLVMNAISPG